MYNRLKEATKCKSCGRVSPISVKEKNESQVIHLLDLSQGAVCGNSKKRRYNLLSKGIQRSP